MPRSSGAVGAHSRTNRSTSGASLSFQKIGPPRTIGPYGVAGDRVAAALDRDREVPLAREAHGEGDVVRARTPRDEPGTPVDLAVPDPARLFVSVLAGSQQRSVKASAQLLDGSGIDPCGRDGHLGSP